METICDHIWISDEVIAKLDPIYANDIKLTNETLDEETQEEVDEVYGWERAATFKEVLYLDYKFVIGELFGTYFHGGPLVKAHGAYVANDLKYLVKHGVYSHNGQEPHASKTGRSYLDFVVMIHDDVVPHFITLLKQLYLNGVNVYANIGKGNDSIQKILFAKEGEFTIITDDFHENTIKFPVGFKASHKYSQYEVKKVETWSFDYVMDPITFLDKKDTHSRFHCEIWRNVFDDKKVEDVLIPLWKEFNTKYGLINDY